MTKFPILIHLNSHLQIDRKLYNIVNTVYLILSVLIIITKILKNEQRCKLIANCNVFYDIVIILGLGGHQKLYVGHIHFETPRRPSSKYIPEKRKK